jgi:Fe2+ or Zn2+ uptake regulation protein
MATQRMLRETKQRRAILDELRKLKTHPTADELYGIVRKRIPRISLGTVYRNLDILAETGLIQRIEHGAGCYRFDGNPHNHYHIRCVNCGRVDDVTDAPLDDIEETIKGKTDFEVLGHKIEYLGLCPECKKSQSD